MRTVNRQDTKRALAHHISGDEYIVEYCSVWGEECVGGAQITAAAGPIHYGDKPDGAAALYDWLDAADLSAEDAEWLQAEDEAGRVSYPLAPA